MILRLSRTKPIWRYSCSASKDNHVRRGVIKHCQTCTLSLSHTHRHATRCLFVAFRNFQAKKKPQKVSEQSKSFAWHPEARRPNLSRQPGQQCVCPVSPPSMNQAPPRLTSLLLYETRNRHSRPELGPERAQTHGKHTSNWQCAEWKRRRRPDDKGSCRQGRATPPFLFEICDPLCTVRCFLTHF